ncbi:hypothetical protein [Streptomyces sp. NPDC002671]
MVDTGLTEDVPTGPGAPVEAEGAGADEVAEWLGVAVGVDGLAWAE